MQRNEGSGGDTRYNCNALGADPGEDDLSRCSSKTFGSCKDWFIDRSTRVTSNGANKILSMNR